MDKPNRKTMTKKAPKVEINVSISDSRQPSILRIMVYALKKVLIREQYTGEESRIELHSAM